MARGGFFASLQRAARVAARERTQTPRLSWQRQSDLPARLTRYTALHPSPTGRQSRTIGQA